MRSKPTNPTIGRPLCIRSDAIVSCCSLPADFVQTLAPAANRSSTKSVSGLMTTWPFKPCGRPMRPTTAQSSQLTSIPDIELRFLPVLLRSERHQCPQRRRRASLTTDDFPHVARRRRQRVDLHAAPLVLGHSHRVGAVDECPGNDFYDVLDRVGHLLRFDHRCRAEIARQMLTEQRAHGIRGLRALLQPVLDAPLVQVDLRRLRARVVRPDVLDKTAVARRTRLGDHYTKIGLLGRAHPPQTNRQHFLSYQPRTNEARTYRDLINPHGPPFFRFLPPAAAKLPACAACGIFGIFGM